MNSSFHLSQASDRPMYQQIVDQVKQRVAMGTWAPGMAIPSIRELAVDIGVSVVTVRRAYLELEDDGVIVTSQGRKSYVAEGEARLDIRLKQEELTTRLRQLVELARTLGLTRRELNAELRRVEDEEEIEDV